MLKIAQKRSDQHGDLWLTTRNSDDWSWAFMFLPIHLSQDHKLPPGPYFQRDSDLDLSTLPLHACKVPSVMLFPYITYFTGTWFTKDPSFVIPNEPLNRQDGRNWLYNLAISPLRLIDSQTKNLRLVWMENDIPVPEGIDYREVTYLASAAKSYLLDEIRSVYDSAERLPWKKQVSVPPRHCFGSAAAEINVTREYLGWYIDIFNAFYSKLLQIGKQGDPEKRMLCFVAGLTISRLAVDAFTILSTDVPSVRKWQFFSFLDALASLINLVTGKKTNSANDKSKVLEVLQVPFFQNELLPVLNQIPISIIQGEILSHTKNIYDSIDNMKVSIKSRGSHRTVSGPELLWAYRNARHGYALGEKDQEALLQHSGIIPDDFPDLVIALWNYLLLKFPFV